MSTLEEPLTFQYLSCTMFEYTRFQVTRLPKLADRLILAGNIGGLAGDADAFAILLRYWAGIYKDVIYVPGPQEFAGGPIDLGCAVFESMKSLHVNIRVISPKHGSVLLSNNVRVIGGFLWGLDPKIFEDRNITLSKDEKKKKKKSMTIVQTEGLHKQDEDWIRAELLDAKKKGERTIVVTHGCPSSSLCKDAYNYKLIDPVSKDLIIDGPDYWVYGAPGDKPVAKIDGSNTTFCVNNYDMVKDVLRGKHVISIPQ